MHTQKKSVRARKLRNAVLETLESRRMLTAALKVIDATVVWDDGSLQSLNKSTAPAGPIAFPFAGSANDEVELANGKTIVAGEANGDFALARYTASGALDTSFSGDGKLTTDLGSATDSAYSITPLSNGKLIATGASFSETEGWKFAVTRYNSNGSLDTTFGSAGKLETNVGDGPAIGSVVAVMSDGSVVVLGGSDSGTFGAARFTGSGVVDPSFFQQSGGPAEPAEIAGAEKSLTAGLAHMMGLSDAPLNRSISASGPEFTLGNDYPLNLSVSGLTGQVVANWVIDWGVDGIETITNPHEFTNTQVIHDFGGGISSISAKAQLNPLRVVANGATRTMPSNSVLTIPQISIASDAMYDLKDNLLIVTDFNDPSVEQLVRIGYAGGNWNGLGGIVSSTAVADENATAVGVVENSEWGYVEMGGESVGATDVLVKYTWAGDANVDGIVDQDDFGQFLAGLSGYDAKWVFGDFNYSTVVDSTDYDIYLDSFSHFQNNGSVQIAQNGPAHWADEIQTTDPFEVSVPQAPNAPTELMATVISYTEIDLQWTDNSDDEAGFTLQRSENGQNWETIENLPANATTHHDAHTLSPGKGYYYRVVANSTNESGPSGYAQTDIFNPLPAAPTNLTASAADGRTITLKWTDNTTAESTFQIERSEAGGTWVAFGPAAGNSTTWSDTDLVAGRSYKYRVRARFDPPGFNSDWSNEAGTIASSIAQPTGLTAIAVSTSEINLTWTDTSVLETSFIVEISLDDGETFFPFDTTAPNAVHLSATGLAAGETYSFRVMATNGTVTSPPSNIASATTHSVTVDDDNDPATPPVSAPPPAQGTPGWVEPMPSTVTPSIMGPNTQYFTGLTPGIYQVVILSGSLSYSHNAQWSFGGIYTVGAQTIGGAFYFDGAAYEAAHVGDYVSTGPDAQGRIGVTFTDNPYDDNRGSGVTFGIRRYHPPTPPPLVTPPGGVGPGDDPNTPEDESIPNLSISTSDATAVEGTDDDAEFTISRGPGVEGHPRPAVMVQYTLSGVAKPQDDYTGPAGGSGYTGIYTATIPADADDVKIAIDAPEDDVNELSEFVVASIRATGAYLFNGRQRAVATIYDAGNLQIDSDNNGVIAPEDDPIEAEEDKPGKIIAVNDDDTDGDGIPDFADGFDFDTDFAAIGTPAAADNQTAGEQFTPMTIKLPPGTDVQTAKLRLTYSDAPPSAISRMGTGTSADPYVYAVESGAESEHGALRVWTKAGGTARSGKDFISNTSTTDGDFWPSGGEYTPFALGGQAPGSLIVQLYVEALKPSESMADLDFKLELDPHGDGHWVDADFLRLTSVTIHAAVDGNRDGAITFDVADGTTPAHPYRFWVNDDHDEMGTSSDAPTGGSQEVEQDMPIDSAHPADATDTIIGSKRDLEDFAPLQVSVSTSLIGLYDEVRFKFVDTGETTPGIRIWNATRLDATQYLRDDAIAQEQVDEASEARYRSVASGGSASIEAHEFQQYLRNGLTQACFIYEGVTEGHGTLKVEFLNDGLVIGASSVDLRIEEIKEMYEHYSVDPAQNPAPETMRVGNFEYTSASPEADDYILFVHGWNVPIFYRTAFAETAYKRLFWAGYRGRFGMFAWPTESTNDAASDPRNYDRSELVAWQSASRLQLLLQTLNTTHPGKVRVLAHSMGNIVVSEALRLEGDTENPVKLVNTYAASQASSVAGAYQGGLPTIAGGLSTPDIYTHFGETGRYFANIDKAATRIVNMYNPNDWALSDLVWGNDQATKPDSGSDIGGSYGYGVNPTTLLDQFYFEAGGVRTWLDYTADPSVNDDRYRIFAFAAPAWTRALGAEPAVTGGLNPPVTSTLNMASEFGFGAHRWEHSAQFNSTNMHVGAYWRSLIDVFGLS